MENSKLEMCKTCRHYRLWNDRYSCDYPMSIVNDCLEFDNHCYERKDDISKSVLPTSK